MTTKKRTPPANRNSAFVARLVQAMDAAGLPANGRVSWLQRTLGSSMTTASWTMNGRSVPEHARSERLAAALHVSHRWLRTGEGGMHGETAPIELKGPLVLAWVSATDVPKGAVVASDRRMIDYDEYVAMAARASAAEAQLPPLPPHAAPVSKRVTSRK